ncbi:MAG: acyltransferase family protein [Lachnospiraceae bacterium]
MKEKLRDHRIDTMKGILISLVILGHLLENNLSYGVNRSLYVFIYSFHMPLFVYTTGYFTTCRWDRLLRNLLYPYVIFQTLYLLFDHFVLGHHTQITYLTPYWILWYLLAVIAWTLLQRGLRFLTRHRKQQIIILLITCVISLLAGYVEEIGRVLSLSRILVFFPFFLFGTLSRIGMEERTQKNRRGITVVAVCSVILTSVFVFYADKIRLSALYEANSYADGGYTILFRGLHLMIATGWIILAMHWIPNRKIPYLTALGTKTMPIYLLHGFFIKWIGQCSYFDSIRQNTLFAVCITFFLLVILQWNPLIRLIQPLLHGNVLHKP